MHIIPSIRSLLFAVVMLAISAASFAQIGIAITIGPPPLPVYEQPPCPAEGYLWTPGYWDYDYDDYYWVPGTWVLVPEVGFLWIPGYWAWVGDSFVFYVGYWGSHIGFYGGLVYGFGYFGTGYEGGHSGFLAYTCPKQTFPTQASPQPLGDHGIAFHMNCELVRGKLLPVTPRLWIGLTLESRVLASTTPFSMRYSFTEEPSARSRRSRLLPDDIA
jgi:hypothetical protein